MRFSNDYLKISVYNGGRILEGFWKCCFCENLLGRKITFEGQSESLPMASKVDTLKHRMIEHHMWLCPSWPVIAMDDKELDKMGFNLTKEQEDHFKERDQRIAEAANAGITATA
jgi:hypothetical protein